MKTVFYFLIFAFGVPGCHTKEKPVCNNFKNGRFLIHAESDNETYNIIRQGSSQFEMDKKSGHESEWKLTWITDCEYKLQLVKDNYGLLSTGDADNPPSANFKIISTTNDYYIFSATYSVSDIIVTDTMFRVSLN